MVNKIGQSPRGNVYNRPLLKREFMTSKHPTVASFFDDKNIKISGTIRTNTVGRTEEKTNYNNGILEQSLHKAREKIVEAADKVYNMAYTAVIMELQRSIDFEEVDEVDENGIKVKDLETWEVKKKRTDKIIGIKDLKAFRAVTDELRIFSGRPKYYSPMPIDDNSKDQDIENPLRGVTIQLTEEENTDEVDILDGEDDTNFISGV